MAEFDAGGFSAVATFFGKDDSNAATNTAKEHSSKPSGSGSGAGRRSRLGLGASVPIAGSRQTAKGSFAGDDVGKKILRVGRSGRGGRDGKDSEILSDDDHDDDDDGEDDDEEGRTSAIKSRPKRKLDATAVIADGEAAMKSRNKSKKKKAGKKERAAKSTVEEGGASTILDATKELAEQKPSEDGKAVSGAVDQSRGEDEDGEDKLVATETITKKKKRKKPKVRSRQKNIYKDRRLAQNKPEHLIFGRENYAGRALTPETRARLKLPESRTSRRAKKHLGGGDNQASTAITEKDVSKEIGLGLAVDDLFDVGVAADVKPSDKEGIVSKPNKKEKKRKKKSKYKNLV